MSSDARDSLSPPPPAREGQRLCLGRLRALPITPGNQGDPQGGNDTAPPLPPSPESAQREPKHLWPDLDAGQSDPNAQAQRELLLPVAMSSSLSLGCDLHISNFACGCVEPRGVVRVTWRVVVMRGAQV